MRCRPYSKRKVKEYWALKCTHKVTRPVIYKSMSAVLISLIYRFGIKHVQSRVKSNATKLISLDSDAIFLQKLQIVTLTFNCHSYAYFDYLFLLG